LGLRLWARTAAGCRLHLWVSLSRQTRLDSGVLVHIAPYGLGHTQLRGQCPCKVDSDDPAKEFRVLRIRTRTHTYTGGQLEREGDVQGATGESRQADYFG
jgi:hypothetical protein